MHAPALRDLEERIAACKREQPKMLLAKVSDVRQGYHLVKDYFKFSSSEHDAFWSGVYEFADDTRFDGWDAGTGLYVIHLSLTAAVAVPLAKREGIVPPNYSPIPGIACIANILPSAMSESRGEQRNHFFRELHQACNITRNFGQPDKYLSQILYTCTHHRLPDDSI